MKSNTQKPPCLETIGVAVLATVAPGIILAHGLVTVLRAVTGSGFDPHVFAVALAVAAAGVTHAIVLLRVRGSSWWPWILVPAVSALLLWVTVGSWVDGVAVFLGATAQGLGAGKILQVLPSTLSGALRRHPFPTTMWTLFALLSVLQLARLSSYMTDHSAGWFLTTKDQWYVEHMCQSAYVYAADLHRQGEPNIYDDTHFETIHPSVENLRSHIEDPFQYPPPFLLLPLGALALTNDFYVIRSLSFAFQFFVFLTVSVWLARWVGGLRGRMALWALPVIFASVPVLQTFQFGQFHLMTYGLAVAGMLCFQMRLRILGGWLLAASIVAKIFPGILVLLLLMQRRFREAAITAGFVAALVFLTWAVLGTAPFDAFVEYQLPRMTRGEVIPVPAITDDNRVPWLASNLSISYFVVKLQDLGLPAIPGADDSAALIYGIGLIALAWRVRRRESRAASAVSWLALLNLGVMLGGGAWLEYAPASSVWLLGLLGVEMRGDRRRTVLLGTCWFLCFLPIGLTQIGSSFPPGKVALVISVAFTGMIVALNTWSVLRVESGGRSVPAGSPSPSASPIEKSALNISGILPG